MLLHTKLRFKKTDTDKDGHVTIKEFEYVRDELLTETVNVKLQTVKKRIGFIFISDLRKLMQIRMDT